MQVSGEKLAISVCVSDILVSGTNIQKDVVYKVPNTKINFS